MTPTVIGVIVIVCQRWVERFGEIGVMTGGVSGDDRGFKREMGGGGCFFLRVWARGVIGFRG